MSNKYIALIPAYKPTASLPDMVQRLKAYNFSVILVNDGSGPEYDRLFDECSHYTEVLHHKANAGKGCAIKTGLQYIKDNYDKDCVIVTVDADDQHRVDDALAICKIAEQEPYTLVMGSRKLKKMFLCVAG